MADSEDGDSTPIMFEQGTCINSHAGGKSPRLYGLICRPYIVQ